MQDGILNGAGTGVHTALLETLHEFITGEIKTFFSCPYTLLSRASALLEKRNMTWSYLIMINRLPRVYSMANFLALTTKKGTYKLDWKGKHTC